MCHGEGVTVIWRNDSPFSIEGRVSLAGPDQYTTVSPGGSVTLFFPDAKCEEDRKVTFTAKLWATKLSVLLDSKTITLDYITIWED